MVFLFLKVVNDDICIAAGEEVAHMGGWVMCRDAVRCDKGRFGRGCFGLGDGVVCGAATPVLTTEKY